MIVGGSTIYPIHKECKKSLWLPFPRFNLCYQKMSIHKKFFDPLALDNNFGIDKLMAIFLT